jgi:hypothetical protein
MPVAKLRVRERAGTDLEIMTSPREKKKPRANDRIGTCDYTSIIMRA